MLCAGAKPNDRLRSVARFVVPHDFDYLYKQSEYAKSCFRTALIE